MISINRRELLQTTAAAAMLPWLEAFADAGGRPQTPPSRLVFVYLPYGVWGDSWYPTEAGAGYRLSPVLAPLQPLYDQISIISNLQHVQGRAGNHVGVYTWLTGASNVAAGFTDLPTPRSRNTVSIDHLAADTLGGETLLRSLVLAPPGGMRVSISTDAQGRMVPAQSDPAAIMNRLFPLQAGQTRDDVARRFQSRRSAIDFVLDDARRLQQRLGTDDRRRVDDCFESIREIERRLAIEERRIAGLGNDPLPADSVPDPPADEALRTYMAEAPNRPTARTGNREAERFPYDGGDPTARIDAYYDLAYLALRTGSTHVVSLTIGADTDHNPLTNMGIPMHLGLGRRVWHIFAHENGAEWPMIDHYNVRRFTRFLQRLATTREGDGTMLDRTLVVFGSSSTVTHAGTRFPIVLAGGRGLGIRHGQHHVYTAGRTPFCNLLLTVAQKAGLRLDRFGDSTGPLTEIG
jgi:hypothetical protein